MEFGVSRKGAAIISLWFVAAGAVLALPFWSFFPLQTLGAFLAYSALCSTGITLRLASCRVRVGAHHLTVRRGVLFLTTRRLPLQCITGCYILRTPLARRTGTCVLMLFSSGCVTLVPGASHAQAEQLAARLMQSGVRP